MVLKAVTSQASHPFAYNQNSGKAANEKITFPPTESLEHRMFNPIAQLLKNKISPDIYDVDCRAKAKEIAGQKPIIQLTSSGCGNG